jgi:hypothetical protein
MKVLAVLRQAMRLDHMRLWSFNGPRVVISCALVARSLTVDPATSMLLKKGTPVDERKIIKK